MTTVNLFEYSSAVRGYHYYRRYWQPQPEQSLDCSHEKNNPYDFFAIKVTVPESGETVGHLPMENSRVTTVLTSTNYCVSPLVQGGLEIPCRVEIHMPSTVKNRQLIQIYETFVDTLYYQREEKNIAGSFVDNNADKEMETTSKKETIKRKSSEKTASTTKDIRSFFQKRRTVSSTETAKNSDNIIEINDDDDDK